MNYFRRSFLDKRLPPFSSLIVLLLSLTTIFWLSRNVVLFGTKAAVGNTPRNVQVSNISDTSFTVSYTTDERVLGSISFGKTQELGQIGLDDRDQQTGTPQQHSVHHITANGLEPGVKYYFSITSGDETFTQDDKLYEVTTAPVGGTPTNHPPLAGKVTREDDTIPTEGIVYIESDTSQLLSALIKIDGSYLLPLNSIRKKDLSGLDTLSATTVLKMRVASATEQSNVTLAANQVDAVPLVILSKNYDFTAGNDPLDSPTASESATPTVPVTGLPEVEDTTVVSSPTILVPEQLFEFKDPQPVFKGKALPNATVEILIESEEPISATVQADSNGNWEYRPATPLRPGGHKITIASPDKQGTTQKIARNFTILVDGSQFLEPSVEPTEAPTPTIALPTEVPTEAPTPSPTLEPSPTLDPNANTSITPTVAPTKPPIPNVGNSTIVIGGIIFSVLSIVMGAILFSLL